MKALAILMTGYLMLSNSLGEVNESSENFESVPSFVILRWNTWIAERRELIKTEDLAASLLLYSRGFQEGICYYLKYGTTLSFDSQEISEINNLDDWVQGSFESGKVAFEDEVKVQKFTPDSLVNFGWSRNEALELYTNKNNEWWIIMPRVTPSRQSLIVDKHIALKDVSIFQIALKSGSIHCDAYVSPFGDTPLRAMIIGAK